MQHAQVLGLNDADSDLYQTVAVFSLLVRMGGGGEGGGENVQPRIPPLALFFLLPFFKVEISLCKLIPLFSPGPVHSGSAS